jgi:Protein of unknown function (DUF3570)
MPHREAAVVVIKKGRGALRTDEKNRVFKNRFAKQALKSHFPQPIPQPEGRALVTMTQESKGVIEVSLQALTTAALVLPGMFSQATFAAEGDEVAFQYSHYQEGKRDILYKTEDHTNPALSTKSYNPIEVEGLKGSAKFSLTDRIKFAFNYSQDTWGGATPSHTVPYSAGGNSSILGKDGTTVVGATPYANAGLQPLYLDANGKIVIPSGDPFSGNPIGYQRTENADKLTHVMAMASPETRKQGDFKLSYDWDNASASFGGGISVEDDYESRFGNIGTRFDFNQKQTTLNVDLSYTNSNTFAIINHDSYVRKILIPKNQLHEKYNNTGLNAIHGTRQDWATHLGLTQVINQDVIIGADFSYTRSTGYLSNPYKAVSFGFIDPNDQFNFNFPPPEGGSIARIETVYEQRPEVKNQWNVGGRYLQYIGPLDAALHFNYNFSADDWGTQAHTFEADWVQPVGSGWTITPRIRYYSQDAATFYTPYEIINSKFEQPALDAQGRQMRIGSDGKDYSIIQDPNLGNIYVDAAGNPPPPNVTMGDTKEEIVAKLPTYFSSDHRLSGFGTLSGGVTLAKQFAKGLTLETGFEYYTHQGGLKIGGGGEGAYADFDYWLANAALKVNLDALALHHGDSGHAGHHEHHQHAAHAPAGVMFDHMLPKAGDFMVGYRYMWNSQSGGLRNGTRGVNDSEFIASACPEGNCYLAPDSMNMSMHMLDLMYAPTDWLTLMLMPQWADMAMNMRKPDGALDVPSSAGNALNHAIHHAQNGHESGGFGDLGLYALFKLYDDDTHHVHITPGFTAPIADVDLQLGRNHQLDGGFMHYCMMLGSGTWDFTPSLTYTGHAEDWSWGAQASGVLRMENRNKSGYRLGDIFQATAWGGYNITPWLTATVRGMYTTQGSIRGQFNGSEGGQFITGTDETSGIPIYSSILKFGSMDYPGNYGGRFGDVGFGLSAVVPSGDLAGNRFSVEWLQPVYNDMNGYQQNRDGTLSASWSVMF